MKYRVIEDRQNDDYMIGAVGNYEYWLNWAIDNTMLSAADDDVIKKQINFFKSISEKQLIDFIDKTWELTIAEEYEQRI